MHDNPTFSSKLKYYKYCYVGATYYFGDHLNTEIGFLYIRKPQVPWKLVHGTEHSALDHME